MRFSREFERAEGSAKKGLGTLVGTLKLCATLELKKACNLQKQKSVPVCRDFGTFGTLPPLVQCAEFLYPYRGRNGTLETRGGLEREDLCRD